MKSLHKKISAVILAVVLVLPVLSQGFVAYADLNVNRPIVPYNELSNYFVVVDNEKKYSYESLYLGNSEEFQKSLYLDMIEEYNNYKPPIGSKYVPIKPKNGKPRYAPIKEYSNKSEFLEGLKNRDLEKYRKRYKFIVLRVGKCYFQIFYNLSDYQRQRIMVELALRDSIDYDFKVICSSPNDSLFGRAEMDAKIMELFKDKPGEMKKLLKEPEPKYRFKDVRDFASRLKSGEIKFMKEEQRICSVGIFRVILESEQGYIRCRIGNYDYVFYYERKDKEELQKKNKEALEKFESNCNNSHNCKKI